MEKTLYLCTNYRFLLARSAAVRCPSDARSCKHGGHPPGVSHKKALASIILILARASVLYLYPRYHLACGNPFSFCSGVFSSTLRAGRETPPLNGILRSSLLSSESNCKNIQRYREPVGIPSYSRQLTYALRRGILSASSRTAFPRALSGPFNNLHTARLSPSRTLWKRSIIFIPASTVYQSIFNFLNFNRS